MGPILLALLIALVAISLPRGTRHFFAACFSGFEPQAVTTRKSTLISDQTGLSADTAESALGSSGVFDTRGWKRVSFRFNVSAITGGLADTNYFQIKILGSDEEGGTFTELAMLATGQLIAAGSGQMPDAAAEFPVLPRFIKVKHDETGTITGYAAKVWADYDVEAPGKEHSRAYQGG